MAVERLKLRLALLFLGIVCVIALMIIFRDRWLFELLFGSCLAAQLVHLFLILRDSPNDV